jgi:hypothetical protein
VAAVLIEIRAELVCPNGCACREFGPLPPPGSARMHPCPNLHGLTAPLVPAGTDCRVVAVRREDYLRGEHQRRGDDGRPYMGVVTEYGDGRNDAAVYAPAALARIGGLR